MTNSEFAQHYKNYIEYTTKELLNIETTYRCPLECPFCQRQKTDDVTKYRIKNSGDMPLDSYKKLLSFCDKISFCGQISDPIYHQNFLEILNTTLGHPKKKFYVNTNGTRKKLDWWRQAFNKCGRNVTWVFGLDGTDQETSNIYRVNTRFDEVMEVMKLGVSLGKNIQWQFIVFKHNEHQIEEAKKIAKDNNIELKLHISGRWFDERINKYKIYPPSQEWRTTREMSKHIIIKVERG